MFSARKLTSATVLSVLALSLSPTAAVAGKEWYSREDPLVAWEDGRRQAMAYGTSSARRRLAYLWNHTNQKDPRPGGDSVYTVSAYNYYEASEWDANHGWTRPSGEDESRRTNSRYWFDQNDKDDYSQRYAVDRGRVHSKVCEDQRMFNPDPCSRRPYRTFVL